MTKGRVTRTCLKDKQVSRYLGDFDDETNKEIVEIQEANALAVDFLNSWGYNGYALARKIQGVKCCVLFTKAHSR